MLSSNHFVAAEFLKMYSGTLFLTTYQLPCVDHVLTVVDHICTETNVFVSFHTPLTIMRKLIERLEEERETLLMFSDNKFLGKFSNSLHLFGSTNFPHDYDKSYDFFVIFFQDSYTPQSETEVNDMF